MELYEREFFIGNILKGYVRYKVDKDTYIHINPPSLDEYIKSLEVFWDAQEEAVEEGVMSYDECLAFMLDNEVWSVEQAQEIKALEKRIEKLKVEIFKSFFHSEKKEEARVLLNQSKKELNKLKIIEHSFDHTTTVGVATYAKNAWIIENCTTHQDGTPYDWKHIDVQRGMEIQNDSILSEKIVRELARNQPWQGFWTLKGEEENLFGNHPAEMTFNQQHIISWSEAYNNVYESMECPIKAIIDDNDAFDGWMIDQGEKREKDRGKKQGEEITEKHGDANEVFIFAPSKEDAERVNDLNDPATKMIKRQRMQKVDSSDGVEYQKFADVKMNLTQQAHEMQKNRNK